MYNKFKKLEFTDDFVFRKVMEDKSNFNICKKNHTDLQISTKSAYKTKYFLPNSQFFAFSLV